MSPVSPKTTSNWYLCHCTCQDTSRGGTFQSWVMAVSKWLFQEMVRWMPKHDQIRKFTLKWMDECPKPRCRSFYICFFSTCFCLYHYWQIMIMGLDNYCWWKKSCTTWDVKNLGDKLLIDWLAGFLPSTVSPTDWCLGLIVWTSRSRFPKAPRDSHPRYSPTGKVGVEGGASSVALLDAVEAVVGRVGSEDHPGRFFSTYPTHWGKTKKDVKICQNHWGQTASMRWHGDWPLVQVSHGNIRREP